MSEARVVIGNLTKDPEVKTVNGSTVCKLSVADTPRYLDRQTNEWKDGETNFYNVDVWRSLGDNVAASLHKGDRVVVVGKDKQNTVEKALADGSTMKVTYHSIDATEVTPSLKYATAVVTKNLKGQGQASAAPAAQPAAAPERAPAAPAPAPAGFGGGF